MAAINAKPHYKDVSQSNIINFLLDTLAFTPEWTKKTLNTLEEGKKAGKVLVVHSTEDNVSDIRGLEHLITNTYSKGRHARVFHPDTTNDFKVIEDFIRLYK